MTDLERLVDALRASSPGLDLTLDWSGEPGARGLAGYRGRRPVCGCGVETAARFRSLSGGYVERSCTGLFEGPEEVFRDFHAAKERILLLLGSEGSRRPRRRAAGG